jgi:hypothetical protein
VAYPTRLRISLRKAILWHARERRTPRSGRSSCPLRSFLDDLYESDPASHQLVNQAILVLERNGPAEGRPLVDSITAARIAKSGSCSSSTRGAAVLLVAGDKSGRWDKWYRTAIPRAEQLYDDYLAERKKEMG